MNTTACTIYIAELDVGHIYGPDPTRPRESQTHIFELKDPNQCKHKSCTLFADRRDLTSVTERPYRREIALYKASSTLATKTATIVYFTWYSRRFRRPATIVAQCGQVLSITDPRRRHNALCPSPTVAAASYIDAPRHLI